jgi:iron complex outermembrane receptor protein
MKVILSSEYTKIGGKGPGSADASEFAAGNTHESSIETENLWQEYDSFKFSINAELAAGPGVITFLPAYQSADGIVMGWNSFAGDYDKSWDPLDGESLSAELRYASKGDATIQWVGGLYYLDFEAAILGNNNPTVKTDMTTSYAAFGQTTIPITDTLRAVLGGRVGYDEKSYHNIGLDPSTAKTDWSSFDWKAGLEADLSTSVMTYLTLASGHRPGGFNSIALAGDLTGTSFDQEALVSAELGIKSRFMNHRLQINADVFYYDYKDYQVADFFTPDGAAFPVLQIYNASAVINYGAEFESEMLLTNRTVGKFSLTYLNSEYQDDFILHGPLPKNLKGYSLPHAPEWTAKFGLEHTFDMGGNGSLTPNVELRWTDDQYVGVFPSETSLQKAYTIYDVAVRYSSSDDKWSINTYIKNAGDEVYVQQAQGADSFSVSSPRTAGVVFSAKF